MALHTILFLFVAGALGGALNAVAGGGSFVAFPALLFSGVAPIAANATNTVALWVGTTASSRAYRKHFDISRRVMIPLTVTSLIGGIAGAYLLLHTPAQTFLRVLPWLMLGATLLFIFGGRLAGGSKSGLAHDASTTALTVAVLFELIVAVYGGYFGGGVGILNLAMLAAIGMTDIHAMNALKVVLGILINGVAVIAFIAWRAVAWKPGSVVIVGALVGGYFGAHYAQKLPPAWIRAFVIMVGAGMTIYFFWKAY
ncbi:MAG: sulfite exporter TauE/SafE family protein [Acidobacteriia bacterium]|nr:sulfite exporter TauE/SafE family protein [Terriglobia bacterium]